MSATLLALALALPAAPAAGPPPVPSADPIGVHARADKASVRLGEPFGYQVEIRHRPEEWYVLGKELDLSPFRADGARCRRDQLGGEARTTCTMQLALFALGPVDVPDLLFEVDRPAGKARLSVPGPRVTGLGVIDPRAPAASLALRQVAPPVPLWVRSYRLLLAALGAAAALALALLLVRLVRRARARRALPRVPTPAERLERRLRALESERLPLLGKGEEHVDRLAEAVREYLGALRGLPALDLTSAELLAALRAAPDPRLDLAALERFLSQADGVKFARRPATPEFCEAGLSFARELLGRTQPPAGGEAAA
ncbi:MAG TPA: hypothetical protein VMU15_12425 [Anaeromyxobacter sp.]|nr:hypothetical protein [Anaeromyxobacter sp.]